MLMFCGSWNVDANVLSKVYANVNVLEVYAVGT
jgi:hypothetical protein